MEIEISEKTLEDIVCEILKNQDKYPDKFNFLEHSDIVIRQLNLNNYGIPDIVTISFDIYEEAIVNIYELKKNDIDIQALVQALRYRQGVRSLFNYIGISCKINIFLIGKNFNNSNGIFEQICETIINEDAGEFIFAAEYKYGVTGIEFIQYNLKPKDICISKQLNIISTCIEHKDSEFKSLA